MPTQVSHRRADEWMTTFSLFLTCEFIEWNGIHSTEKTFLSSLYADLDKFHGPLYEYIEREVEYYYESSAPGGDNREHFEDWKKYARSEGDEDDLRHEFARAEVDDLASTFYKGKHLPVLLDFIEDPDDPVDVALNLGYVRLTEEENQRIGRMCRRKRESATFWEKFYAAQHLRDKVAGIQDAALNMLCRSCMHPVDELSDRGYASMTATFKCDKCGEISSRRSARLTSKYLFQGPFYIPPYVRDFVLLDGDQALPVEGPLPAVHFCMWTKMRTIEELRRLFRAPERRVADVDVEVEADPCNQFVELIIQHTPDARILVDIQPSGLVTMLPDKGNPFPWEDCDVIACGVLKHYGVLPRAPRSYRFLNFFVERRSTTVAQGIPLKAPAKLALSEYDEKSKKGVPWRRAGIPGKEVDPKDKDAQWKALVANTGSEPQRLMTDDEIVDKSARFGTAPIKKLVQERTFALFWDFFNNTHPGHKKEDVFKALHVALEKKVSKVADDRLVEAVAERAFAMFWDRYNNYFPDDEKPLLYALLDEKIEKMISTPREREIAERVAQSVMQWIGTKVGTEYDEMVRKFVELEVKRLMPLVQDRRKIMQAAGELPMPSDDEIKAEYGAKEAKKASDADEEDE